MRLRNPAATSMLVFLLAACTASDSEPPADEADVEATTVQSTAAPEDGVVEVIARDFVFEAPSELPPGWTTFRLVNQGTQEHFMAL